MTVAECARPIVLSLAKIKAITAKESDEASIKPIVVEGDMPIEVVVGLDASLYNLR